jgi:hypothetical protein
MYLYDDTNQLTFSYSLRQLAFDRRSAELLNSPAAFIDGKKVHVSGLGYVWPLNAKKQSYEILDRTLNKPELTSYTATATIDGLKTYVYVEQVAPTQFGTQTLPGPLVGLPNEQTVQVGEFYTGTRTDWVDPITGAPVQTQLMEHTYLAATSGTPVLNLLNGTFTTSPSSVSATVAIAKHYDAEIGLISLIIPAIIAIAGVIILLIGLILGRRPRAYYYEAESAQDLAGTAG